MKSGQGIDEYVKRNELEGLYNSQKKAFDDKFSDINMVLEKMREVISIRFGEDFGNNKYDKELESIKAKIYTLQEEMRKSNPMDEEYLNDKFQNIEQNIVKSRKIIEEYTLQFKEDIAKIEDDGRDRTLLAKQEKRIKAFKDDLSNLDKELRKYIVTVKDTIDKSNDVLSKNLFEKVSQTENLIKTIEDKLDTRIDGVRFQIGDVTRNAQKTNDEIHGLIDTYKKESEDLISEIEKRSKEKLETYKGEVNDTIAGVQKDIEANQEANASLISEIEKQTKENLETYKGEINDTIAGVQKDIEANQEASASLISEIEKRSKENLETYKGEINEAIVGIQKDIEANQEASASLISEIEKQTKESLQTYKDEVNDTIVGVQKNIDTNQEINANSLSEIKKQAKENIEILKQEIDEKVISVRNKIDNDINDVKNIVKENNSNQELKIREFCENLIIDNKKYIADNTVLFDGLKAEIEEKFNKMSDIVVYNKQTTSQELNKLEEKLNLNLNAKIAELNYSDTLDKIDNLDKKIEEKYENDYKEIQKLCNTIQLLQDRIDFENEERKVGINKIREDIGSNGYYMNQMMDKLKELELTNNAIVKQMQELDQQKQRNIGRQKIKNGDIKDLENSLKEMMNKQIKSIEEKYDNNLKQLEDYYNKRINDLEFKYKEEVAKDKKESKKAPKKVTKVNMKKSDKEEIGLGDDIHVIPFEEKKNEFLGMYPKVNKEELKESASDVKKLNIEEMITKLESTKKSSNKAGTEVRKKENIRIEATNKVVSDNIINDNNIEMEVNKPAKRNQILGNFE